MNILQITTKTEQKVIGRLSDMSDREMIEVPIYEIEVEVGGKHYIATFYHKPTNEELEQAFKDGVFMLKGAGLEEQIAELKENNLILMDALATVFEEVLSLKEEQSK